MFCACGQPAYISGLCRRHYQIGYRAMNQDRMPAVIRRHQEAMRTVRRLDDENTRARLLAYVIGGSDPLLEQFLSHAA